MDRVINVNSLAEAMAIISQIEKSLEKPPYEEMLKENSSIVGDRTRKNFLNSESPDGTPWAPLKYRVGMPLILTGLMMTQALSAAASPVISGQTAVINPDEPFYNLFHLFGTRNMPARPWIGVSEETVDEMADADVGILCDFLFSNLGKNAA